MEMSILLITQARVGSSRFPAKILKKLDSGKSLFALHLERLKKVKTCDYFCVATTKEKGVEEILSIAAGLKVRTYQGSTDDVLDRFYQSLKIFKRLPDAIVRITSDCPLIDPKLVDELVNEFKNSNVDYLSNTLLPTYPDGQDIEIFSFKALEMAWTFGKNSIYREHVTPYIWQNSNLKGKDLFSSASYENKEDMSELRMTLDYEDDFLVISKLIEKCGEKASWAAYSKVLLDEPGLRALNSAHIRNEGRKK